MTMITEGVRNGEFVLSEANGTRSREVVVISDAAPAMVSGTAVGMITATGKYSKYDNAASNGLEVCKGILYTTVPDSTSDQKAVVIKRDAEISYERTVGVDSNAQVDLLTTGIVVRGPTNPFVIVSTP